MLTKAISGFTLIEMMITIFISSLICSVLIETYLSSVQFYQLQQALLNLQSNAIRASYLLKTKPIQQFYIGKTARHYKNGVPIYALYMVENGKHKEMVEGMTSLKYQLSKTGVDIEIQLMSPPITKKWYVYVAIN